MLQWKRPRDYIGWISVIGSTTHHTTGARYRFKNHSSCPTPNTLSVHVMFKLRRLLTILLTTPPTTPERNLCDHSPQEMKQKTAEEKKENKRRATGNNNENDTRWKHKLTERESRQTKTTQATQTLREQRLPAPRLVT